MNRRVVAEAAGAVVAKHESMRRPGRLPAKNEIFLGARTWTRERASAKFGGGRCFALHDSQVFHLANR